MAMRRSILCPGAEKLTRYIVDVVLNNDPVAIGVVLMLANVGGSVRLRHDALLQRGWRVVARWSLIWSEYAMLHYGSSGNDGMRKKGQRW